MSLTAYRVEIQHGTCLHSVVLRARDYEEAVEEAARVLGLDKTPIEATVREVENANPSD
jgi:hypothetical protein